MNDGVAIAVKGLRKAYGEFEAVRGIDFQVRTGEVFGLLGPNGAGKTTTVEILEGLRNRSAGDVSVLGYDPGIHARDLRQRIGVCLQSTNLPEKLTVAEAVDLFASLYSRHANGRALLERLQLRDKRDDYYGRLSGGQKQRLALVLALINDPRLVFLDEPTSGLDAQARLEIHRLIQDLRRGNRTILLTTHYIEEAERLCDRVAIIDSGHIIAIGAPREIQARTLGHSHVEIICESPLPPDASLFLSEAERFAVSEDRHTLIVSTAHPARTIVELVRWIEQHDVGLSDIHLRRPTLEDVFIELTGKTLRE